MQTAISKKGEGEVMKSSYSASSENSVKSKPSEMKYIEYIKSRLDLLFLKRLM